MSKPFRFHPVDAGLSTQRISLTFEGEAATEFPAADLSLPEDQTARFWAVYNFLVSAQAIPNDTPVYTGG
jgi:hypothetical protein